MSFSRTRPPEDSLTLLLDFIHQQENAGNALLQVVAGTQNGAPFNLTEFQFTSETLPPVSFTPVTQPIDTDDQADAVRDEIEKTGKTLLFFAPILDANLERMIAICRAGAVEPITPAAESMTPVAEPIAPATEPTTPAVEPSPAPATPAGAQVQSEKALVPNPSEGHFLGNFSKTTGLVGTETTFSDGTVIRDGTETLTARRGGKDLGSKTVRQIRTIRDGIHVIQQAGYAWQTHALTDAVLMDQFVGFPPGTSFTTGKATEFGKHDNTDEGTGSELLKVVQTNSEVFGCSLKQSILASAFGTPLRTKRDLTKAQVEIFNPRNGKFARVPIVDVGPAERLEAVIDLTFALDKYLETHGSGQVQFRIVV